jgi:hypothetical protein
MKHAAQKERGNAVGATPMGIAPRPSLQLGLFVKIAIESSNILA